MGGKSLPPEEGIPVLADAIFFWGGGGKIWRRGKFWKKKEKTKDKEKYVALGVR